MNFRAYEEPSRWKYWVFQGFIGALALWIIASALASGEMSLSQFLVLLGWVAGMLAIAAIHGRLLRVRYRDTGVSDWRKAIVAIGVFLCMIAGALIMRDYVSYTGWTLMIVSIVCQIGMYLPIGKRRESSEAMI